MTLILNDYLLDNGADRLVDWASITELTAPAEKPENRISGVKGGTVQQVAGAENWLPRRGRVKGRIRNQTSITAKIATLGAMGVALAAASPATIQFQGRMLKGVKFQAPRPLQDALTNHPSAFNYEIAWQAKDPFWWDLGPWGAMGYNNGAQSFGLQACGTNVDSSQWFVKATSGGSLSLTVPGSACAYGVGSVSVGGAYTGTIYLKSDKGYRYTAIKVTNGVGIVQLSDRLYLAPGANVITAYTLSGGVYSAYTAQTVTINLGQTYARWIGLDSNSLTQARPTVLARMGSANHINTSGSFAAVGDGASRIGLPHTHPHRNVWAGSTTVQASHGPGAVKTLNQITAPDNTNTGALFTFTSGEPVYQTVRVTPGQQFTFSFYALKGTKADPYYRVYDLTGSADIVASTNYGASLSTSAWTRITVTFTAPAGCVQAVCYVNAGGGAGTLYIWGPQVERGASATTHQPTLTTGAPDLTHPWNGAGLILEGQATNLFTSNQATASDTLGDATGFNNSGYGVAPGATITSDTAQKLQGARSIKVVTDGTSQQGVMMSVVAGVAGTTYTFSCRIKGTNGDRIGLYMRDAANPTASANTEYLQLTGNWDAFTLTFTAGTPNTPSIETYIRSSLGMTGAITFWIDCLQLEARAFATSWMDGGATRNGDIAGVCGPHNVTLQSERFDLSPWAGSVTVTYGALTAPDGTMAASLLDAASGSYADLYQVYTVTPGATYTYSLWLRKGTATATGVEAWTGASGGSYIAGFSTTSLSSSAWERRAFSFAVPAGITTIRVKIMPGYSTTGTVYAWGAQLVEGSNPGAYVRTTDAAILPAGSVIDPSWTQNGSIELTVVLPPAGSGPGYFAAFGALEGGVSVHKALCLFHSDSDPRAYFDRRFVGATGTQGRITHSSANLIWDGLRHTIKLSWSNYLTSSGVRVMLQELWIDGVLVASQDVAALYGATSWATPDISVLFAAGDVFATISYPKFGRPTIPTGALAA